MNGPQIRAICEANGIKFVQRPFGQCTTAPVTLDGLTLAVNEAIDQAVAEIINQKAATPYKHETPYMFRRPT